MNIIQIYSEKEIERWMKHGILGCGYAKQEFIVAEAFMRSIIAIDNPEEIEIKLDLEGLRCDLSKARPEDLLGKNVWDTYAVHRRVFTRCVGFGFFFNNFVHECEKTKLFDSWFLSKNFMEAVNDGWIKQILNIYSDDKPDDKPDPDNELMYSKKRFKKLIDNLDFRGLNWTQAYLSNGYSKSWE